MTRTGRPSVEYKATLADWSDLRRAGLDETPANPAQGACSVVVLNVWVLHPLDASWMAAYRLVVQGGTFVVGEVRIYPNESGYSSGDWSGVWRGLDAEVPEGGLTTTAAREGTVMQSSLRDSRAVLHALKKWNPSLFAELRDKHGLITLDKPKPANPTSGRLGKPMKFYKAVATEYRRAMRRNSRHPVQDVALALHVDSDEKARDAVYRARKLGLLPPTTRGCTRS